MERRTDDRDRTKEGEKEGKTRSRLLGKRSGMKKKKRRRNQY